MCLDGQDVYNSQSYSELRCLGLPLDIIRIVYIINGKSKNRLWNGREGDHMKSVVMSGLSLVLGLVLVNIAFAAERVVVCEEWYQET